MKRIDIDHAIRLHTQWRRQFMNAFAGGAYADMPLSEHRGCLLASTLNEATGTGVTSADYQQLVVIHERFHHLANEIVELSNSGLGDSADLLLPELNESSHQLVGQLDRLREYRES
ncbi:MAG: hypothetical protein H6R15_2043 [Proteobacteria bacterium]|nr:hypothetical protein [Pseudomonadota bacterium]